MKKTKNNTYPIFSTMLFSNGVYQGLLVNNIRQGFGIYIWDSGEIYFGKVKLSNQFYHFL